MTCSPVIAVLDDNRSVRRSVAMILANEGLDVEAFGSGVEFLASGTADRCVCIVLDMFMPDMSGLEVMERLRAAGVAAPIVVMTGSDDAGVEAAAWARGARFYLLKPFEAADLTNAVRRAAGPPLGVAA